MTSSLVRRPSLPVPLMRVGSTPCSSTRRRTAGESVSAAFEHCLVGFRSEEHTSELQSLMRISYAVFCLKKKQITKNHHITSPKLKQNCNTRSIDKINIAINTMC